MSGLFSSLVFNEINKRCYCKKIKFVIKHIVGIKHAAETEHLSFLGKFDIQIHYLLLFLTLMHKTRLVTDLQIISLSSHCDFLYFVLLQSSRLSKSINQTDECYHL